MVWLLLAIAGLWMADGVALLAAPLWIVGRMKHILLASPAMTKWSGVTLVAGLVLLFAARDLGYTVVWMAAGAAMIAKGGFFLLAHDDTRHAVLQWCLSREAVDYRFAGLALCALSLLLIHALGGFEPW